MQNIIVACSDGLKNKQLEHHFPGYFNLRIAGGPGGFLGEHLIDLLINQISAAIHLKHSREIVLVNHSPCGYYRSKNRDDEESHQHDLQLVVKQIRAIFPNLKVSGFIMNHESGDLKSALKF